MKRGALRILLAAALALPCALRAQDTLLAQVLARLGSYPVVRADFSQERTLLGPERTLSGSGRIVFSRDAGLIWEMAEPVRAGLVITPSALIETDAAGGRRLVRPGMVQAEIGRLVRGIMSGDVSELGSTFELAARGEAERWTIDLVPRAPDMARYLRGVHLAGGRHLERIEIREASGEATRIRMRNFTVAAALDADERRQFLPP
jgi:hypothetical protein